MIEINAVEVRLNDILTLNSKEFNIVNIRRLIVCGKAEIVHIVIQHPNKDAQIGMLFDAEEKITVKDRVLN